MFESAHPRRGVVAAGRSAALVLVACALQACGGSPPERLDAAGVSPRVVALVPSLSEIVVALGGAGHLVARTDYDDDPAVVGLPSIGGGLDPSFEALVGLDVDVVLMTVAREAASMGQRLGSLGIEMRTLPTNTIDDVYAAIEHVGDLIGREAAADSLAGTLREGLTSLESRLEGRAPIDVMYVVWSDPPMTTGGGTFVDELIRHAGGRNVFDDAPAEWPTVGFETIVDRDPDVIVWPRGEDGTASVEQIRTMPGWRDVQAVRRGSIVFIDAASFNQPGPGLVESARRLAEALHPEAF